MNLGGFQWDPRVRQYRGSDGRFVSRQTIRQVLDEVIDSAAVELQTDARLLQANIISLPEWQLRMERHIKLIHTASAAMAAGGWAQASAADWAQAGRRIKAQYKWLEDFAYQIQNGLPLDGRFIQRAVSYASSGTGTYEAVLRRLDLATKRVLKERRVLHSTHPCDGCIAYAAMGWQDPGVLPDIGSECECGTRCRCTFQRRFTVRGK